MNKTENQFSAWNLTWKQVWNKVSVQSQQVNFQMWDHVELKVCDQIVTQVFKSVQARVRNHVTNLIKPQ